MKEMRPPSTCSIWKNSFFGSGSEDAKGFQNGATGDADRQAWNHPAHQAPDLNLKPEDYSRLRELWEAERLKNLATKGEFKQQSYQDWLTDRLKPIIDLWPRKDDGSVDWPHIDINVKTREEIAREKSEWEQNPENRGIDPDYSAGKQRKVCSSGQPSDMVKEIK